MTTNLHAPNDARGQVVSLVSAMVGDHIEQQLSTYVRSAWHVSPRFVFEGRMDQIRQFVYGIRFPDVNGEHNLFRGPFPKPLGF